MWDAKSGEAQTVRQARPETLAQLRQVMACLVSDRSDKSDKNAIKQEVAANTMICLINQETFLLGRQIVGRIGGILIGTVFVLFAVLSFYKFFSN